MKKSFAKFLSLALIISAFSISCKKNDVPKPTATTDEAETVFLFKPVKGETALSSDLQLSQFKKINASRTPVKKVTVNSGSSISISGLKNNVVLHDVVLQLKNDPSVKRPLGSVSKDQVFNSAEDIVFLQKVVNDMFAKKATKVDIKLKSSDVLASDVKVVLKMNTNYQ